MYTAQLERGKQIHLYRSSNIWHSCAALLQIHTVAKRFAQRVLFAVSWPFIWHLLQHLEGHNASFGNNCALRDTIENEREDEIPVKMPESDRSSRLPCAIFFEDKFRGFSGRGFSWNL